MNNQEALKESVKMLEIAEATLTRMRERGFYLLARTSQSHADLINQQISKIKSYTRLIESFKQQ